jgi:hypothetical protein
LLPLVLSYFCGKYNLGKHNKWCSFSPSFISPAIVAPETVDVEVPKDDGVIRRGLMIIAKVMQNLANNIFFAKEAHMVCLNEFLKANITNVTRFLSEVNVSDFHVHTGETNAILIYAEIFRNSC